MVWEARGKEMEYFESMKVWTRRDRSEAFNNMGKAPISTRCTDVSTGDGESPNYRSRHVAREIRRFGGETMFAPTPSLESIRPFCVLSLAAADLPGGGRAHQTPEQRKEDTGQFH